MARIVTVSITALALTLGGMLAARWRPVGSGKKLVFDQHGP